MGSVLTAVDEFPEILVYLDLFINDKSPINVFLLLEVILL